MIRQTAIAVIAAACLAVSLSPVHAGTHAKPRKAAAVATAHMICPLDMLRHHVRADRPARKAVVAKAKPAPKKEASLKDAKPAKPAKPAKKA